MIPPQINPARYVTSRRQQRMAGLTLMEMLVVAAIIALLTTLTLPSMRGLVGVGGLRGGVNTVTIALDQARAAAIENGVDAYVGFPPAGLGNEEAALSNLIVFRAKKDGETTDYTPLTRWMKLPRGIFFDLSGVTFNPDDLPKSAASALPRLEGQDVNPRVIRYDRFGRIRTGAPGMEIRVGDGVVMGGELTFKSDSSETLKAQRLTGRWLVKK